MSEKREEGRGGGGEEGEGRYLLGAVEGDEGNLAFLLLGQDEFWKRVVRRRMALHLKKKNKTKQKKKQRHNPSFNKNNNKNNHKNNNNNNNNKQKTKTKTNPFVPQQYNNETKKQQGSKDHGWKK